jgi:TPR repeat protein
MQGADRDLPTPEELEQEENYFRRLRQLAESGDPQAQRDLGCAYIHGKDTWDTLDADPVQARRWYTLAAKQGHIEAMWDVCEMLLHGEGGPPDVELGLRFLNAHARHRRWYFGCDQAADYLVYLHSNSLFGLSPDEKIIAELEQISRDMQRKYRGYCRRHPWRGRLINRGT